MFFTFTFRSRKELSLIDEKKMKEKHGVRNFPKT